MHAYLSISAEKTFSILPVSSNPSLIPPTPANKSIVLYLSPLKDF